MGDKTSIEWTDATWNPVRGCSRVSEGCRNCYAENVAARFSGPGMAYEGLAKRVGGDARWTGVVRLVPEHLADPLRWQRPRRIFVNSMSDLFHEGLAFEEIAAVFGVMAAAPEHTMQVLTKRPARARAFCEWIAGHGGLGRYIRSILGAEAGARMGRLFDAVLRTEIDRGKRYRSASDPWMKVINAAACDMAPTLPRNVWLGVSVENQATADERIPLLLQLPAAVRFVSYEPALGPVDFDDLVVRDGRPGEWHISALEADVGVEDDEPFNGAALDWIIVGGESGPGARPFDVEWARSTVRQCKAAGVACFVKQLGARPHELIGSPPDYWWMRQAPGLSRVGRNITDSKGGDWSEWPEDLRVREMPR